MKFWKHKTEAEKIYKEITSIGTLQFFYNKLLCDPMMSQAIYDAGKRQNHILIFSDNSMLNFVVNNAQLVGVKLGEDYKLFSNIAEQLRAGPF